MKNTWRDLVLAVLLGWGVPWLLVSLTVYRLPPDEIQAPTLQTTAPTQAHQLYEQAEHMICVLGSDEAVTAVPLDEYLVGVLLGEIPGSFHMEAKKAQAVVARTYALRTASTTDKHPGAVCTDSTCCQGYMDPKAYLKAGGSAETVAAAKAAVEATSGLVLLYNGQLIDATYFSCSGGHTEDAVAVWGADVPYLQAVESPGEEMAAHYTDTVSFTAQEFEAALGADLPGSMRTWLGTAAYTEGGGVASMEIGGKRYKGTELRTLLNLRSTAFTIEVVSDRIVITTRGYGHRVGMSQYGAQAMALSGSSYTQILAHYYLGTALSQAPAE